MSIDGFACDKRAARAALAAMAELEPLSPEEKVTALMQTIGALAHLIEYAGESGGARMRWSEPDGKAALGAALDVGYCRETIKSVFDACFAWHVQRRTVRLPVLGRIENSA
jgi:hypothetical protein